MTFPATAENWDGEQGILQRIAEYLGNIASPETGSLTELVKSPTAGHTHDGVTGKVIDALAISKSNSSVITADVTFSNSTAVNNALAWTLPANTAVGGQTVEFWLFGSLVNASAVTVVYSILLTFAGATVCTSTVTLTTGVTRKFRVQAFFTVRSGAAQTTLIYEDDAANRDWQFATPSAVYTSDRAISVAISMDTADALASWTVVAGRVRPGKPV